MKKRIVKLLMVGLLSCMLVGCGNSTLTTADEAVSVSGKVSVAKTIEVEQLEETTIEYVSLEGYLEENTSAFVCYNITMADENGNLVQPKGAVDVKIKLTEAFINANGDTYAIFYVNGENFTKLDCSEVDGYVTFKTDHFSVYAMVKYEADKSAISELANGKEMEIPHIHKYEVDEATVVAPTCTEIGKEADEFCLCGDKIVGAEIEALGHNYEEVADSSAPATCDTDGKEADTKCSICESVVEGVVIPASGHSYGEYVYNNDASTSADGTETATCSVCSGTDTRTKAGTKIALESFPYEINVLYNDGRVGYFYCIYDEYEAAFGDGFHDTTIGKLCDAANRTTSDNMFAYDHSLIPLDNNTFPEGYDKDVYVGEYAEGTIWKYTAYMRYKYSGSDEIHVWH